MCAGEAALGDTCVYRVLYVFGVYSEAVTALGDTCVYRVLYVFGVYSKAVTALGDTCVTCVFVCLSFRCAVWQWLSWGIPV